MLSSPENGAAASQANRKIACRETAETVAEGWAVTIIVEFETDLPNGSYESFESKRREQSAIRNPSLESCN